MRSGGARVSDNILKDNLWTLLVRLAVPGILGMLLIGLNTFVDAVFVGRLVGQDGLAGVSLAFPLTLIVSSVAMLIGTGSASVLSRAIGAGDEGLQRRIIPNIVALSLIGSALLSVVGYAFAGPLVAFMGGEGEVAAEGTRYFEVYILGAFFSVYGVVLNMQIRAEGKIKEAMTYAGIAMLVNMGLNAVLMGWLGMGVRGAALATTLAMAFYSVQNTLYFMRGRSSFPSGRFRVRLAPELLGPVLGVGASGMLTQLMSFMQQGFIFKSIAYYGTAQDVAFMGAGYRILLLFVIPVFGIMQALQPVIGINYGAHRYDRARKAFYVFLAGAIAFLTVLWLPILLFPAAVLSFVLPEATFTARDVFNFRLLILSLPLVPLVFTGISLFQSIGRGGMAGFLIAARQFLFFIPLVLLLPPLLGVDGIYVALALTDLLCIALTGVVAFRAVRRLRGEEEEVEREEVHESLALAA